MAFQAGATLYDQAANDHLKADFATLANVVTVLAPLAHGMGALAESGLLTETRTGFALSVGARGIELTNEFMMPASFLHDLDAIVKDQSLGGPEKKAAIAMLFGRGLKDGIVTYVKVGPHGTGHELVVPEGVRPTEGITTREPATPRAEPRPRPEPAPVAPTEGVATREPAAPAGGSKPKPQPEPRRVAPTEGFVAEIEQLLSANAVQLR